MKKVIAAFLMLSVAATAQAMNLVPGQSSLHFVSVKKESIGEVHKFDSMSGSIDDNGQVDVSVDLASVDTGIPIRDTRMKQYLFETDQYPQAVVSATLDIGRVRALKPGESYHTEIAGELNLHGMSADIRAAVRIVRLADSGLLIYTVRPILLNASDFDLVEGIDKLRELAGLPGIDRVVPVTFSVVFR